MPPAPGHLSGCQCSLCVDPKDGPGRVPKNRTPLDWGRPKHHEPSCLCDRCATRRGGHGGPARGHPPGCSCQGVQGTHGHPWTAVPTGQPGDGIEDTLAALLAVGPDNRAPGWGLRPGQHGRSRLVRRHLRGRRTTWSTTRVSASPGPAGRHRTPAGRATGNAGTDDNARADTLVAGDMGASPHQGTGSGTPSS